MALIKNMGQLPTELLSAIFSHVNDRKSIRASRLVSHKFKDVSTPYLIREISVCMRSKSLATLEKLCNHPVFSKSISKVTIILSFFEADMAADRALYMRHCESQLYPCLELLERSRWTSQKTKRQRTEAAEQKEREEVVAKLWKVVNSHEIGNISADDFDEASATVFQKLVLRLHAMYKERCDDQEQVRQDNKHIKRICTALCKLANLTQIKFKDLPYLVSEKLKESDFEDLGLKRNHLEPFRWAVVPSQFSGSYATANSVHPPLEMIGELASQLGHSGIRPKAITMDLIAPTNLRPIALTPSQQAGVRELVSKATDLSFSVDGWMRKGTLGLNNHRPRDEMLALCSLTRPYFTSPKLESLHIDFYQYPRSYETAPTVGLLDILPLQKPWPQLDHVEIRYLPAHLEELRVLVAMQNDTVTSFVWDWGWLLSGRWDQAFEALRGFDKLNNISLDSPRGERYKMGYARGQHVSRDQISSYILKETDTNPLPEVPFPVTDGI